MCAFKRMPTGRASRPTGQVRGRREESLRPAGDQPGNCCSRVKGLDGSATRSARPWPAGVSAPRLSLGVCQPSSKLYERQRWQLTMQHSVAVRAHNGEVGPGVQCHRPAPQFAEGREVMCFYESSSNPVGQQYWIRICAGEAPAHPYSWRRPPRTGGPMLPQALTLWGPRTRSELRAVHAATHSYS